MSYTKVSTHTGWIYDSIHDDYISPKGRTASSPGAPFTGQVSKKDLEEINTLAESFKKPLETTKVIEEPMAATDVNLELVKTYRLGDVTINIYKAS